MENNNPYQNDYQPNSSNPQDQSNGMNNAPDSQYPQQNYGATPSAQPPYPQKNNGENNKPPKKNNRLPLIIGISVAIVAIIAVILILVLGGDGAGKNKSEDKCSHKYGNWITDDKGIECQNREYYKECKNCGHKRTRDGSESDHDYSQSESETICGHYLTFGICKICGKENDKITIYNPLHSSDSTVTTCYNENEHWLECSECKQTSDKVSHSISSNGSCSECGYGSVSDTVPEYEYSYLNGTYNITLWVPYSHSYSDNMDDYFRAQIDAFEKMYPGIKINAEIESVSESDAAYCVFYDLTYAPDIYCFVQDQLTRLVQVGGLAKQQETFADWVRESNDNAAVLAASYEGNVYAYPFSSDNGYYMYYDKSIITESDAESMERLIEICEQNGRTFHFALDNAWYNASFFMATGCESIWRVNEEGEIFTVYDTYNSEAGLVAMQGMQKLAQSSCYSNNVDYFGSSKPAVIITGIWMDELVRDALGNNYAVTDLPSFAVDGNSYHLGSYSGHKLMGIKPQTDSKKAVVLSLLAQYLTGAECQSQRFDDFQWIPSNIEAQQSYAVQSYPAYAALAKQAEYAKPQGMIYGAWWDVAAYLGSNVGYATSKSELEYLLITYENEINSFFS